MAASVEGKVIAITGAASGIALATAQLLASRGATISLADVNLAGLDEALKSLSTSGGQKHLRTVVDVRDSKSVDAWIASTVAQYGRLDGAANLAGVFKNNIRLVDTTDDDFAFHMNVNTAGLFYCMRAQLRVMKPGASIVNAASLAAQKGAPGISAYCASKHAVLGLTRAAAREHPELRVNAVAPGLINTPMVTNVEKDQGFVQDYSAQCMQRKGEASEVAAGIAYLLSNDATFVTGSVLNVDGGWNC